MTPKSVNTMTWVTTVNQLYQPNYNQTEAASFQGTEHYKIMQTSQHNENQQIHNRSELQSVYSKFTI